MSLVPVHGGLEQPIDRTVPLSRKKSLLEEAEGLSSIAVTDADLSTVYRIGDGTLSPLTGPMDEATWNRVLDQANIERDGTAYASTIPPALPLSDRESQDIRDEAIPCLRGIGIQTGGSNVPFAVDPATGRRVIIEMNPRVSRSSALASKATGFPIAKMAALLAVGFTLDEITNDITKATPAAFEPALDYVVVKIPRFDFAKFPSVAPELTTAMKSCGAAMAIGRPVKRGWRDTTSQDLWQDLAQTSLGGLLSRTALIILVLPALYYASVRGGWVLRQAWLRLVSLVPTTAHRVDSA